LQVVHFATFKQKKVEVYAGMPCSQQNHVLALADADLTHPLPARPHLSIDFHKLNNVVLIYNVRIITTKNEM
jgi:hypothetical protein